MIQGGPVRPGVLAEFGHLQGPVRRGVGQVQEEGTAAVGTHELLGFGRVLVEGVAGSSRVAHAVDDDAAFGIVLVRLAVVVALVFGELDSVAIAPEVCRVVAVGFALVQVSEEGVEAHVIGKPGLVAEGQAPLAEEPGGVPGVLEDLGHGEIIGLQSVTVHAAGVAHHVVADGGMSLVQSLHQARAGGSADRGTAVAVGQAHAAGGQGVDVRCLDQRLAEAAQIAPAQIVGHDPDDVRFVGHYVFLNTCNRSTLNERVCGTPLFTKLGTDCLFCLTNMYRISIYLVGRFTRRMPVPWRPTFA